MQKSDPSNSIHERGVQLDVDALLDEARDQANLHDFGDRWFEGPLRSLVHFINKEGRLVSAQARGVRLIVSHLVDRLRWVEYLREHPEVYAEEVDVAGIIIGLGRGGSTLCQRLVGASPQLTSVHYWELIAPLPEPGSPSDDVEPRIEKSRAVIKSIHEQWPDMKAMHPVDPFVYDEEIQFMERTFQNMMWPFYVYVPGYWQWLRAQDFTKVYDELTVWLKLLQHQNPDRRGRKWLLKSGEHMFGGGLDHCARAFPDAKLITTHRRLDKVIGSFCSMQSMMIKPDTIGYDPKWIGPQNLDWYAATLRDYVDWRDTQPRERLVDIQYDALVKQPIETFRTILSEMGLQVSPADVEAAERWMASNRRDTHPPHDYSLADYGLTSTGIEERLEFYHDRFLTP